MPVAPATAQFPCYFVNASDDKLYVMVTDSAIDPKVRRTHGTFIEASRDIPYQTPAEAVNILSDDNRPFLRLLPTWDVYRRELRYLDVLVKRFSRVACNQERLLVTFEEEKWPCRIDDPLIPNSVCPKVRLRDTVKHLNRNHDHALIRFRTDGTGEGVIWELTANMP